MNRTLLYLIASTASTLASTTSCRVCSRETDVLAGPCDASAPEVEAISRAGVFWGEDDRVRRRLAVALRRHPDVGLVSCAPGIAATARMGLANLKAQHQIGPVLIHNGLWRNGGHRNYPHNALVGHCDELGGDVFAYVTLLVGGPALLRGGVLDFPPGAVRKFPWAQTRRSMLL